MLALRPLCFYSCLEGELPHPRRLSWVLWAAAGSRVPHGLCGCHAHSLYIMVAVHGFSGRMPFTPALSQGRAYPNPDGRCHMALG